MYFIYFYIFHSFSIGLKLNMGYILGNSREVRLNILDGNWEVTRSRLLKRLTIKNHSKFLI
jgi:hypothetical protein